MNFLEDGDKRKSIHLDCAGLFLWDYPKIFAKNLPSLWKKPDFCCGFGWGAGGASAIATGPVFTDGPNPGAGVLAVVAALSGVAIPEGVPVGTVCVGAV